MASKNAREHLRSAGLPVDANRFDQYDSLETAADLSALFDVLSSVKDKNGNPFVFTAFALPANIHFERMVKENYQEYRYELLPETLQRLPGHEGTWPLWLEGMKEKFMVPQFHGREHANVKLLMELLSMDDPQVLSCFKNRSFGAITTTKYPTIDYASAFDFAEFGENACLSSIVADGLQAFKTVFGINARNFNAPGRPAHETLEKSLADGGVKYIDVPLIKTEHQGNGKYRKRINYLGKKNSHGQRYLVRNCVFEPLLNRNADSVDSCMAEIKAAFALGKPANISSHRVNFCGHIDSSVRDHGLLQLKTLIGSIKKTWPEVEFMSADQLGDLIAMNDNHE
jgi:hypothetical protein